MKNIIAFMNMKGGVCKTTLCVNVAYTLAKDYNKKVLVIDMDPQFNATQYALNVIYKEGFSNKHNELKANEKTIYNLYDNMDKDDNSLQNSDENLPALFNTNEKNTYYLKQDYIANIANNFDFIIGDIRLVNLQIVHRTGNERVLKEYIDSKHLNDIYDYIFIDSPPTYSTFFMSSYIACDAYVVPLKPDFVAALGLSLLNKGIDAIVKTGNEKKPCLGLVYTLIDTRNNVHEPICRNLNQKYAGHIFKNQVLYYSAVPKGIDEGRFMVDIMEHDINKSIKGIAEELMERMGRLND